MKHKILLIEDNPVERLFYSRLFSEAGYFVSSAASTDEANDFLAAGEFDLALCDLVFENQPAGLELLRGVKKDRRTRHIPFVMFTSYPEHCDELASALELGASDCLMKGEPLAVLKAKVAHILGEGLPLGLKSPSRATNAKNSTVLLVDDDEGNLEILSTQFTLAGYNILCGRTAEDAVRLAKTRLPEAIVMDYGLPGKTGLEAVEILKSIPRTARIPVLMLTARQDEATQISCLQCGVDNYLIKDGKSWAAIPLHVENLARKSLALLGGGLAAGLVNLDPKTESAHVAGREIPLNHKEFVLLRLLVQNSPKIVTWEEIQRACWACARQSPKSSPTIRMTLSNLKKKLGPEVSAWIQTERGSGVRFADPD